MALNKFINKLLKNYVMHNNIVFKKLGYNTM
jgi:hypothetical protein